ncbi:MAG TPA: hypothetical protein DCQ43_01490 [Treponema sp.]|nr:hypothetical protein [Treponema sp.]
MAAVTAVLLACAFSACDNPSSAELYDGNTYVGTVTLSGSNFTFTGTRETADNTYDCTFTGTVTNNGRTLTNLAFVGGDIPTLLNGTLTLEQ